MTENAQDTIVAYCGLVCTKCYGFRKGKCQGCHSEKPMYKKCPVKKCNIDNGYSTCADCKEFTDLKKCKKLYNIISRIFGLVFRTNRMANLEKIKQFGIEEL